MATPVERVQVAWANGGRMALHREVEHLATEGYSQQTLEDAMKSLLLEVRAAGETVPDTVDVFFCVVVGPGGANFQQQ